MAQLIEFSANHAVLISALLVILILLVITEAQSKTQSSHVLSPQAAVHLINHQNAQIFDLREIDAFRTGHIIHAKQANSEKLNKLNAPKDKTLLLVCANGQKSSLEAAKLKKQGFTQVHIIKGGINAWSDATLPLTTKK